MCDIVSLTTVPSGSVVATVFDVVVLVLDPLDSLLPLSDMVIPLFPGAADLLHVASSLSALSAIVLGWFSVCQPSNYWNSALRAAFLPVRTIRRADSCRTHRRTHAVEL